MNAAESPSVLCIGSVLWDVIGHTTGHMRQGADVPGRITRRPGGVALNIAMTLVRFGLRPVLLSAVGRDAEGDELISICTRLGMVTDHIHRSGDLPTDRYMAIEGANGLIAAIADAHSLEAAGNHVLHPLIHGPLGRADAPFEGIVALDGNLTGALLEDIARSPAFAATDLRVAPASPGKAERLRPFLTHARATLYLNREEAGILAEREFAHAQEAAQGLLERGARRVMVTDGPHPAAWASADHVLTLAPPRVRATRVTGAGDTFMAAHIAAELAGADPETALSRALQAAAAHVSGEPPP